MIDAAGYREKLLARVNALKAERTEKDAKLAELESDIAGLLAPLKKLGALLPASVKNILGKYGF